MKERPLSFSSLHLPGKELSQVQQRAVFKTWPLNWGSGQSLLYRRPLSSPTKYQKFWLTLWLYVLSTTTYVFRYSKILNLKLELVSISVQISFLFQICSPDTAGLLIHLVVVLHWEMLLLMEFLFESLPSKWTFAWTLNEIRSQTHKKKWNHEPQSKNIAVPVCV